MVNPYNPWTTLATRRVYDGGWLALEDRRVRDPAGHDAPYAVVLFKKRGLRILPIDSAGCTHLVGQYRYAADYFSWELPAGGSEPGEDLERAARRELSEEVGLSAEHSLKLLDMVATGSLTDNRQIGFVRDERRLAMPNAADDCHSVSTPLLYSGRRPGTAGLPGGPRTFDDGSFHTSGIGDLSGREADGISLKLRIGDRRDNALRNQGP
jgi:8-oxo-dGTP pyrophosphatase MutT (NUDIX family)